MHINLLVSVTLGLPIMKILDIVFIIGAIVPLASSSSEIISLHSAGAHPVALTGNSRKYCGAIWEFSTILRNTDSKLSYKRVNEPTYVILVLSKVSLCKIQGLFKDF